jgi:hypothetical protein
MHTVYPINIIIVVVYVVWNNDEISAVIKKLCTFIRYINENVCPPG